MDDWKTTFLLGMPIFRCYVSFREGSCLEGYQFHLIQPSVWWRMPQGLEAWPVEAPRPCWKNTLPAGSSHFGCGMLNYETPSSLTMYHQEIYHWSFQIWLKGMSSERWMTKDKDLWKGWRRSNSFRTFAEPRWEARHQQHLKILRPVILEDLCDLRVH